MFTISRRAAVLAAGLGAALTLAACDTAASVTQPDATRKTMQATPHFDDTDSTTCLSGYLDATGRWVCT